mmetsp:Transcript_25565/g.80698  ORF Transcript_25565/g.80698 Transcript_25565/m.80698 type:complete len:260 (-) Transcript_25565:60-839(-)
MALLILLACQGALIGPQLRHSPAPARLQFGRVGEPQTPAASDVRRSSAARMSAHQIPAITYTCAAAGLVVRASRAAAPTEVAVLAAAALLALVDFGPTSAKQLRSAQLAIQAARTRAAPDAIAQEQAWLCAIAIKVAGQLAGLVWMNASGCGSGVLRGGALMMAGNICFWIAGAGAARHDEKGEHAPVPPKLVRMILAADAALFLALLASAVSPVGTVRRAVGSWLFAAGAMAGVSENLGKFVRGLPGTLVGVVPQTEG